MTYLFCSRRSNRYFRIIKVSAGGTRGLLLHDEKGTMATRTRRSHEKPTISATTGLKWEVTNAKDSFPLKWSSKVSARRPGEQKRQVSATAAHAKLPATPWPAGPQGAVPRPSHWAHPLWPALLITPIYMWDIFHEFKVDDVHYRFPFQCMCMKDLA